MPPTPIEAAEVARGPLATRLRAVGTVEASESVVISSELEGRVKSLPLSEGASVKRGALLAEMDDAELKAQEERARALLQQSRTAYERTRQVVAERVAPEQNLDDATAALKVAEANLEFARVRLAKTRITAPFDGVLGARLVSPGAWLRTGDPIARLTDASEVKVRFAAPERLLASLRPGVAVEIATTAWPGEPLTGKVDLVDQTVDPATRNVAVRARAANPDGRLRPGMSADVSVILSERADALTVPSEAVFAEGEQFFVFRIEADSSVKRVAVTLGTRTPEAVEITGGLAAGDRVVRSGHQKLHEGAKVAPIEPRAQAGTAS